MSNNDNLPQNDLEKQYILVTCNVCGGSGEVDCRRCNGDGYVVNSWGDRTFCDCDNGQAECFHCKGTGQLEEPVGAGGGGATGPTDDEQRAERATAYIVMTTNFDEPISFNDPEGALNFIRDQIGMDFDCSIRTVYRQPAPAQPSAPAEASQPEAARAKLTKAQYRELDDLHMLGELTYNRKILPATFKLMQKLHSQGLVELVGSTENTATYKITEAGRQAVVR